MKLSEIHQRLENNYVFDKAGDVVVSQDSDMEWLLDRVAQIEAELENKCKQLDNMMIQNEKLLTVTFPRKTKELQQVREERDALVRYARAKRNGNKKDALKEWIGFDEAIRKEIEGGE